MAKLVPETRPVAPVSALSNVPTRLPLKPKEKAMTKRRKESGEHPWQQRIWKMTDCKWTSAWNDLQRLHLNLLILLSCEIKNVHLNLKPAPFQRATLVTTSPTRPGGHSRVWITAVSLPKNKEGSDLNEDTPSDHQSQLAVVAKRYRPFVSPHLPVSRNRVLKLHATWDIPV